MRRIDDGLLRPQPTADFADDYPVRYESELRGMLSHSRYIQLRKRLAELVMDSVRVEDKVYCLTSMARWRFC